LFSPSGAFFLEKKFIVKKNSFYFCLCRCVLVQTKNSCSELIENKNKKKTCGSFWSEQDKQVIPKKFSFFFA